MKLKLKENALVDDQMHQHGEVVDIQDEKRAQFLLKMGQAETPEAFKARRDKARKQEDEERKEARAKFDEENGPPDDEAKKKRADEDKRIADRRADEDKVEQQMESMGQSKDNAPAPPPEPYPEHTSKSKK